MFLTIMISILLVATSLQAGTTIKWQAGSVDPIKLENSLRKQIRAESSDVAKDFVVQFESKIQPADRRQLEAAGVKVFKYVPDDAYVVRATEDQLVKVQASNANLRAFVQMQPEWRLDPSINQFSVFSKIQNEIYLISCFSPTDAVTVASSLGQNPEVQVMDVSQKHILLRAAKAEVLNLAKLQGIEFIQLAPKIETMEMNFGDTLPGFQFGDIQPAGDYSDLTGFETGTRLMNFETMYARGFTGKSQIVGMADTGLDSGDKNTIHADFKDAVYSGYAFGVGSKNWEDPNGHGTHVMGSVLGRGTKSGGALRGGAFDSMAVAQGMWSPLLDNLTVPPKLVKLFQAALTDGARIHTNSWGSPNNLGAYDGMAAQVDEFMFQNQNFLVLFAAGNSGRDANKDGVIDEGSVSTPGTSKNSLTVGASENLVSVGGIQKKVGELKPAVDNWPVEPLWSSKLSDNDRGIAVFSSRGPTRDGRLKPEVVAPGTNILSVRSQHPSVGDLWGRYNSDYAYAGGTSMATPLTAGAAAVVRQFLIEGAQQADPSAALVKATLIHSAQDLFPGQYGLGATQEMTKPRPNPHEGYGRVDLAKAYELKSALFVDERTGVGASEVFERSINLAVVSNLRITLVYTDAPGTPSAAKTLVNDLDLILELPDGTQKTLADRVNNNEMLELSSLPAGVYKIRVRGENVPMGVSGKQPFALVASTH